MKRKVKRLGLALVLAVSSLPQIAAEQIFTFDFEDQNTFTDDFTVENLNEDDYKWEWSKYTTGSTPYYFAQVYYWNAEDYNDNLITKKSYPLYKGHAYCLKYKATLGTRGTSTSLTSGYRVEGSDEMTELKSGTYSYVNKYAGEPFDEEEVIFEVPEDGEYYFVFHASGGKTGVLIDDISLEDAGSPMTPLCATSLTVVPAEDFSLKATLKIELPTKTVTGSELSDITKVEILNQQGEVIGTITENLVPGKIVEFTDENAAEGENEYTVYVYSGEHKSEGTTGSCFAGPLTPQKVSALRVKKDADGSILIQWDKVSKSVNGIDLNDELTRYTLSRIEGEEKTLLTETEELSYTDSYSPEEMTSIKYEVVVSYGTRKSEATESAYVKAGSYSLPFEESFADDSFDSDWEVTTSDTSTNSTKKWNRRSSMQSNPSAGPYDNDGGLLTYNSYNIYTNCESQAITPAIGLKGATSPTLEFMFYHSSYTSSNDYIELLISKDGGEFELIPDSKIERINGTTGWAKYEFPLEAYKDAEKIRVSFKAVSMYGADMAIDAVKIHQPRTIIDLEAMDMEAPTEVISGQDAVFRFTVKNSGNTGITGEDYKINVYVDGELANSIEGEDIAAKATLEFTHEISTHPGHAEKGIPVYAEIECDEDENLDNNTFAEITVAVSTYAGRGVQGVTGKYDKDSDTLTLSWEDIEVEDYEPLDSSMTFDVNEEGEPFLTKEAYDNDNSLAWPAEFTAKDGNIWKNIDADGQSSDKVYSTPAAAKGFMVMSFELSGNKSQQDFSGIEENGMLEAVAPSEGSGAASDYLISPLLPGSGDHILTFQGKSYSFACTADFTVEYTTSEELPSAEGLSTAFTAIGEKIHIPNTYHDGGVWKEFEYVIPREAKYVAIHFTGETGHKYDYSGDKESVASILCLDDIRLVSEPEVKPTYNVYYREYSSDEEPAPAPESRLKGAGTPIGSYAQKHNSEPIEGAEYVIQNPVKIADYHVTAVYPKGETALSEGYHSDVETGIEETGIEEVGTLRVEGRNITSTGNISVYAIDGTLLANGVNSYTAPEAGAYIIKSGTRTLKVVVR